METLGQKKNNPYYFEPCYCESCETEHDLQKHKYTDEILCSSCIQDLMDRYRERGQDEDELQHKADMRRENANY